MIWIISVIGILLVSYLVYRMIATESAVNSVISGLCCFFIIAFCSAIAAHTFRICHNKPFPAFVSSKRYTSEYTKSTTKLHSFESKTTPAVYILTLTSEDGKKSCTFETTPDIWTDVRPGTLLECSYGEN